MLTVAALRGYVLEEVLARLLYSNGYRLLVSAYEDSDELIDGGHGLLVRGRGANHQADVLGDLAFSVPFSLPIRLFVEAKHWKRRVDLPEVRNAHGVIHDVNEHYATATAHARALPVRRHLYQYALFSASGFTKDAQLYALAQQISLVDLSGPAFRPLLEATRRAADELIRIARAAGVQSFSVGQVRAAFRYAFGSSRVADYPYRRDVSHGSELDQAFVSVADGLLDHLYPDLLLGFPAAPFVVVLRPDDPVRFPAHLRSHGPDIKVTIRFAKQGSVAGDWVIEPADGSGEFRLRFAIPGLVKNWLVDGDSAMRAWDFKADMLSSIAVFHDGRLIRLLFEPDRRG
ncbi:restriction endonuclease [Amycolatopsis sp. cg5]|uniref:restriction endonuclease n=1 Tax=Amycolatopsis sp. cg5 TaxID=3238802 RepID=UPI003525A45B